MKMPPQRTIALLSTLVNRDATTTNATATNATSSALQVVCAFPLSGQYGPGSRVLYYVLIAACVFARRAEWLRNPCLAAALFFPSVAALHGIVLAALHIDGAVDMDVYGAFQLCSIGILAAPVTVRLSRTYFYDPGRNIIFVWTVLVLAGLLSLTVEFFRIKTSACVHDDSGNPIPSNPYYFPYPIAPSCGLTCSINEGPYSPIRQGSANNIYVIPAPDRLTFGMATLLAAACCIPAILSLVSMWNKILEINWKSRNPSRDENTQAPIEGTNGATIEKMTRVNALIRRLLSVVEIPVFGAAVLLILVIGELNFFSRQVNYQTEPIVSIGQWAPIVGSTLAVLGSLYLLRVSKEDPMQDRNPVMRETGRGRSLSSGHRRTSSEIVPTTSQPQQAATYQDVGYRRKVAENLNVISNLFSTPTHDPSGYDGSWSGEYPEVPGEINRNRYLTQTRDRFKERGVEQPANRGG